MMPACTRLNNVPKMPKSASSSALLTLPAKYAKWYDNHAQAGFKNCHACRSQLHRYCSNMLVLA